jgi:AspT/YidE/YbjL antiporter-like protein
VTAAAGSSIGELEKRFGHNISVQRVVRDRSVIKGQPSVTLKAGDRIVIAGRREALVEAIPCVGEEVFNGGGSDYFVEKVDVMLTNRALHGLTLAQARARANPADGRGVFVAAVTRLDSTVPALPGTQVQRGDVLTLVGSKEDVTRGAAKLGYIIRATQKTDFVFLGLGVLVGIGIGRLSAHVGGIDLSLGTGGGCLLAGLVFGWIRSRYPVIGSLPSAAAQILKDFGLCTFIAAVGLSAGADALRLIREFGIALPLAGIVITLVPALASLVVGRVLLKLDVPMLLGAIAGQQCSTPAISALVGVTGNATPVIGYTITYAISNVLLPLLGPLVVGLVSKLG